MSTRAIAAAAGVQAPTLYRLFGDKQGLLDAVTAYGFERYLAEKKTLVPSHDPVADLQRGWDNHVEFGLTHPAFYVLMYGVTRPERRPAAAEEAYRMLLALLERVAAAGRLRMPPTPPPASSTPPTPASPSASSPPRCLSAMPTSRPVPARPSLPPSPPLTPPADPMRH